MSDAYIRCFGCDRVFNISRAPFCPNCERCTKCGQKTLNSNTKCRCGFPLDDSLEQIIRDHAIPATDVEFELKLDKAHERLLYARITFSTVASAVAMVLMKIQFNLDAVQGYIVLVVALIGTMVATKFIFDALARSMANRT